MTQQEIINLLKPKIQNKGVVTTSTVFDLSLYGHFTLSLNSNITVSFINVSTPAYVIIEVLHTTAGTSITNIPGNNVWNYSWAPNINDTTILRGIYDGTNWNWTYDIMAA